MKQLLNKRYCPHCTKIINGEWDYGIMGYIKYSENPIWLFKKEGKYGKFWGCPNFPKCNYSENISDRPKVIIDYEDELRHY